MAGIYGWIQSLTGFFLFLTILNHLLPGKQDQKYIRLFAGMVLLLVIGQPLVRGSGLADRIADEYESLVFQYDTFESPLGLSDMGDMYRDRMIAAYEEEVASNVMRMAKEAGYPAAACRVSIGKKEGTERYGRVETIRLDLAGEETETAAQAVSLSMEPIVVEPVKIGEEEGGPMEKTTDAGGGHAKDESMTGLDLEPLRVKLAAFYGLEEGHVEIQIAQGER